MEGSLQTIQNDTSLQLTYEQFPSMYKVANKLAEQYQRNYTLQTQVELIMLIAAATLGVIPQVSGTTSTDWFGIAAAVAFGISFILQGVRLIFHANRIWFNGRTLAESAKTMVWRYSVGGDPFRVDTTTEARSLLITRYKEIVDDINEKTITKQIDLQAEPTTAAMETLRSAPLEERRRVYAEQRINDQLRWYTQRAQWNGRLSRSWSFFLLLLEGVAVVVAILRAVGVIQLDLLGLGSAIAAAATSWLQLKQHETLAQSYKVAANELKSILGRVATQRSEASWAQFVEQSEEAISRENTLWRASHTPHLEIERL